MTQEILITFPVLHTKHTFFRKSFFLAALIEWNNLDIIKEILRVMQSLKKLF